MTRKRHTEEQTIAVLKDAHAGIGVQELCHKHGISDATFDKWRAKYAGLEVSDVKKLRQLLQLCLEFVGNQQNIRCPPQTGGI